MPTSRNPLIIIYLLVATTVLFLLVSADSQGQHLQLEDEAIAGDRIVGRELTVLSPTLPPEALDRAVLNRLLQEITHDPETVMARLQLDESSLADLRISIANAGGFINNNEMANVRAMCQAWQRSELDGDERVAAALQAYRERRQFTLEFIATYYQVVIREIEAFLSPPSRQLFQNYMTDRRRRMAQAGNVLPGVVAENVQSGAEAVAFHCRR